MTKQSSKEAKLQLAQPVLQEPLEPISISVKELITERKRYTIPVNYQRKKVWGLRDKQQFIDSLMLGDPFPPVEGYEGPADEQGLTNLEIGDGQNRLGTLIEFVLGGFKTWTVAQKLAAEPNSKVGPIQPGKFFKDWDPIHKSYLLNKRRIRIDRLRDRPEMEKATRFIRVQTHVKLTAAEILNAFPSKAKAIAQDIERHSFWGDFYEGQTKRGQLFQSSLYLLALEMAPGGMVDLQNGDFIKGLVAGTYDDNMDDTLVNVIKARLKDIEHVYYGAHFTVRGAVVAMYQSVMFLEQTGYVIQKDDRAKLTDWIMGLIAASNRASGLPSYDRPMQQLPYKSIQEEFWKRRKNEVLHLFGIDETPPVTEEALATIGQGMWERREVKV